MLNLGISEDGALNLPGLQTTGPVVPYGIQKPVATWGEGSQTTLYFQVLCFCKEKYKLPALCPSSPQGVGRNFQTQGWAISSNFRSPQLRTTITLPALLLRDGLSLVY